MGNSCFRNIRFICIAVLISFSANTFSQDTARCDLKFVDHLVKAGLFKEALFVLDSAECSSVESNDSTDWFRGWSYFSLNNPELSSDYLLKILPASPFYIKSHFYAAYNYAGTSRPDSAVQILENIELKPGNLRAVRDYQIAGLGLLHGDIPSFIEWYRTPGSYLPELGESSGNLIRLCVEMEDHKVKSRFVAGLLSGIIPGSGKFYAGRKGEGIAAFLSTVSLGLITWENYRKDGLKDFKTLAFGSAFAIVYTANIYGSVISVRISETEYNDKIKNTVLFNLRIPLDRIFGR
jgi:TM2 domain-containing membrane protein YozV